MYNTITLLLSTVETSVWGVIGLALGGLITYLTSKGKNTTEIEVAKINSSKDDEFRLKQEIKDISEAYDNIKKKYEIAKQKNIDNESVVKDYENLIRHYRFIFKLFYEIVAPKLESDSEAIILLDEVKDMFAEDYKLK
jgi:esterase/lipase